MLSKPPFPVLDRGHPLAQGLIFATTMHEGAGLTLNDLSGQGHNGTFGSSDPTWSAGQTGYCLSYTGSGEVTVPAALSLSYPFTVAGMFLPSGNQQGTVFIYWSPGDNFNGWMVYLSDVFSNGWQGMTVFSRGTGGIQLADASFSRIPYGSPAVYVAIFTSATSQTIWCKPRADLPWVTASNTNSVVPAFGSTPQGFIGGAGLGTGANMLGQIDGTLIWNRALTEAEVKQLGEDLYAMFRQPDPVLKSAGGGTTNYSLSASAGSYTITGSAATLITGRKLPLGAGSYTITGSAATLATGRKLALVAGSYTLTGAANTLRVGRGFAAAAGAYTLTGDTATLATARKLPLAAGAYTLTGQAATLAKGYHMIAGAGGYTLTGQTAMLPVGRRLPLAAGAYLLTGQPATFTTTVAPAVSHGPTIYDTISLGYTRYDVVSIRRTQYDRVSIAATLYDYVAIGTFTAQPLRNAMFNPSILHIASTYTFSTCLADGKTPGPLLIDGVPVPSGAGITVTVRFSGPTGTFERPATYNSGTQAWAYASPVTDFPDGTYAGAWLREWHVVRTDVSPNIDVPSEPGIPFTVLAY